MKIKTKLIFFVIITIIFSLIGVLTLYITNVQFDRIDKKTIFAENLIQKAFQLSVFSYDYFLNPSDETQEQWLILYNKLESSIEKKEFREPITEEHVKRLKELLFNLEDNFFKFVFTEDLETRKTLKGFLLLGSQEFVNEVDLITNLVFQQRQVIKEMSKWVILFLFFIISLWSVAMSLIFYKTLEVPLRKLYDATKKIAFGDYSHRVEIRNGTEFAQIARSFNVMIAKLRGFHGELQERVREQTRDLQKFKLAADNISEHIIITDSNAKILYVNKAAEYLTGYSREEMIGQQPSLWGGQMPKEFYEKMWHVIKVDKKIFASEILNKRKNGQQYFAELHISPILDQSGNIEFFVGIERDLTQEKENEKMRQDFLALASHQLRSPLSGTKWLIETMQREVIGELNEKQKNYLEQIYNINERMIKLVFDMLNVLRLEGNILEIKRSSAPISINDILKDIMLRLGAAAKAKQVIIRYPSDEQQSLLIISDAQIIKSILESFISNAINFSEPGKEVIFGVESNPEELIFSVQDDGIGIPRDEQKKIFERFYRASNAKIFKPDGTGLGLYMANMLAERIGAKIYFKSEEGKGSVFYLSIPKQKVEKE